MLGIMSIQFDGLKLLVEICFRKIDAGRKAFVEKVYSLYLEDHLGTLKGLVFSCFYCWNIYCSYFALSMLAGATNVEEVFLWMQFR